MSDELITRLSADLKPVPPRAVERRLFGALLLGLVATGIIVSLGFSAMLDRPLGAIAETPMFWVKFSYTVALGLLGLTAIPALARPDRRLFWPLAAALAIIALALASSGLMWMRAGMPSQMLMGSTALICPILIVVASLPILATMLWALRSLAPRSPALAGGAAGLVAGGLGAWVYSLYCGETGMLFMAVWYSLGIVLTAVLGALVGRTLLRW